MSPQPRLRLGCGDIWESVVSQPWPQTRYQFLQLLAICMFFFSLPLSYYCYTHVVGYTETTNMECFLSGNPLSLGPQSWWHRQMERFSAWLALYEDSPHKGQWRGFFMFSLTCAWTNDWANNRDASDLIRHRAHYNVTVMSNKTRTSPRCNISV